MCIRDSSNADVNFGSSLWNEAKIGSTGNNRETYIRFDLAGLTSTVNSATLRLFARLTDTASPSVPIAIFSADGAWSESAVTWNNRPATSGSAIVTGSINGNVAAWYDFNITSFIEAARLAGKSSVTLVIRATAATSPRAAFSSIETDDKPLLVINTSSSSTPTPTAPAAPTNLQAQLAAGQVNLTWADDSSNETGFEIQRKTGADGTWGTLTTLVANQTSYSDAAVASGTQYFYRVRAINDAGNSDWSNETDITTPAPSSSVTINASADAYVRDGSSADTNFGSSSWNEAKIASTGNNRETYISFNLTSLSGLVSNATLRLFARLTDTSAASVPVAIFSTDGAWSQNALTWNNRPATSGSAVVTGSINGNVAAWYDFNITSFIEAARLAGKTSVTLVIRATASTSPRAAFSSIETPEKPHLVINGNGTTEAPMAALNSTVIGSPSPAGSTTVLADGSDYDVSSGSGDIWGNADSFRFVHTSLSGDFDVAVRVAGLDASNPNAQAALMARDTLDDNSRNIAIKARTGSYRFTYRANTGGNTAGAGSASTSYPNTWLRLVRTGNTFTSYISSDGITWQLFASQTQSMPQTLYVGLAVAGIDGSATAQFRDLTIA